MLSAADAQTSRSRTCTLAARRAGPWFGTIDSSVHEGGDAMTADVGFLRDLVLAPGPSGFEQPAQQVVRERVAPRADAETDVLGNVTATINPGASPQIVVAGH